ncbi:MAG: universal stress protein [Pseudomonadota bacterium]
MPYKSIIMILTHSDASFAALEAARDFAEKRDAHLDVLALGIDRSQAGFSYTEFSAALLEAGLEEARKTATSLGKKANALLNKQSGRYATVPLVAPIGAVGQEIARYARFGDLAIMPLPYGDAAHSDDVNALEAALFSANIPVLAVPGATKQIVAPKRIVFGWNESAEAMAAARSALPFLVEADTVFVTVIDPPQHGPDRSDPGGLVSQYLARHGVRCEIDVLSKSMHRVGDVLLRQVEDCDADMLVMGAYGRARWSEAMFGGATRQMLEFASVPVLMAR